jgi:hypothetical protein
MCNGKLKKNLNYIVAQGQVSKKQPLADFYKKSYFNDLCISPMALNNT